MMMYTMSSNITIDSEKIDYSHGERCMKELYNERNVVVQTWDDFLKLPKIAGYEQNVKRVPNTFSHNVIDKAGDPYTKLEDCLNPELLADKK